MVIQCPECQARFKMADEKAKNGVKVRCSRCKHVFPVQVSAVPEQVAPAVAPPPAQQEVPPTGGVRDPFMPTPPVSTSFAEVSASGEKAGDFSFDGPSEQAATPPSAAGIDGFDLADFSIDTEAPGAGPAAAASSADELDLGDFNMDAAPQFATEGAAETEDFPLDEENPATEFSFATEEEKDSFDFSGQPATEDFSFGTDATPDDFSFDGEPATAFAGSESDSPTEGATEDAFSSPSGGDEFSFGDISPDSAFAIDPPQPAPADAAASDWSSGDGPHDEFDFAPAAPAGGAEEFDFSNLSFGDENQAAPPVPPLSPAVSEVLPPLAAAPAPPPMQEPPAPATAEDAEPIFIPPPKKSKSAFSGLPGAIVLLLLLGGAAAYFFWQGTFDLSGVIARISGEAPPSAAAGQIRLTDLNGYFVDNAEAGQLFVIQGRVVNEYPEARSAIAVKGVLYNQAGQPLMQQTVFSGNMLDENALRTLPFAKIEENMNNQFGDSLSNLNVAPGKSLPFTIVFRNLPGGLAEFTTEVTDSKPGAS